jgi:protein O-GlcNAc transferase
VLLPMQVQLLRINTVTRADVSEEALPTVSPYQAVTFPFTPAQTQVLLEAYAADILAKVVSKRALLALAPPPPVGARSAIEMEGGGRLRIAYLSSDFGDHTTGVNVAGIFRAHSVARVRVYAYATSPDDGSATRRRIEAESHVFRDVHDLSDAQMAFAINADGVHVLVDMNGHTLGARSHVVALQPAPLTLFDQGFAGSSGGIVSYLNADRISAPPELANFYTEALLYMPVFSNPLNDHRRVFPAFDTPRPRPPSPATRAALLGLPPETFVYACFNSAYKFCPAVFDAFAKILKRTAQHSAAALWLLQWPGVEPNLRRRASTVGLAAEQLVFSPLLPQESHLETKSEATDLFLDTFSFNGHGTVSQMLWAAVPTLTLPKQRLGQRIGAALVANSAVAELVARTEADYVAIAQACATRRGRVLVRGMRQRLHESRASSALFDLPRYVRDYERLLHTAWDAHQSRAPEGGGAGISGEARTSATGPGRAAGGRRKEFHVVVAGS